MAAAGQVAITLGRSSPSTEFPSISLSATYLTICSFTFTLSHPPQNMQLHFQPLHNLQISLSETSQPAAPKRNSKSFPASVNGTSGSNTRPTKFPTKVNGHQQDTTESKTANTSVHGGKTSKTRLNETQTSIVKNPQSPQTSSAETQPVSPPTRKTYKKVKKIPVSSE